MLSNRWADKSWKERMKLDRMLGITMELLTRRRVTATELAAKFEDFLLETERKIHRLREGHFFRMVYDGKIVQQWCVASISSLVKQQTMF